MVDGRVNADSSILMEVLLLCGRWSHISACAAKPHRWTIFSNITKVYATTQEWKLMNTSYIWGMQEGPRLSTFEWYSAKITFHINTQRFCHTWQSMWEKAAFVKRYFPCSFMIHNEFTKMKEIKLFQKEHTSRCDWCRHVPLQPLQSSEDWSK